MGLMTVVQSFKSTTAVVCSMTGILAGGYFWLESTMSGEKYEPEFDLTGKTYIVTGASSGIGQTLAADLAKRKARVILLCRDREKCISVRRDIVIASKNKQVYCRICDLSDFENVRHFALRTYKGKIALDRIDGIVNNAAELLPKREVNKNGIEKMLATNHLGHFLLTGLLLDKLLKQDNPSKIVFVNTNTINRNAEVDFENMNADKEGKKFNEYDVYKTSKLSEALFAKELSERLKNTKVSVVMADPGGSKTHLEDKRQAEMWFISRWITNFSAFVSGLRRKPEKAIRPVLYALADPEAEQKNGVFIDRERKEQPWPALAEDEKLRQRLWAFSEKWTHFVDHLRQLQAEQYLGEQEASKQSSTSTRQKTWKTLWL
jgi:NAD(P)-dependent dehydrogenase (short-subunit alcohol dehydrogenase family)